MSTIQEQADIQRAEAWTKSMIEEVIGCLWLIAAVAAFGFRFELLGCLLAVKSSLDISCAIWLRTKEVQHEINETRK